MSRGFVLVPGFRPATEFSWRTAALFVSCAAGSNLDVFEPVNMQSTIGDLAGVELPTNLGGSSISPLQNDPAPPWNSAVFLSGVSGDHGRMVRNRRYSYVKFLEGDSAPALFDLQKDPWVTRNELDEPAHAGTRRELTALPPEDARKIDRNWGQSREVEYGLADAFSPGGHVVRRGRVFRIIGRFLQLALSVTLWIPSLGDKAYWAIHRPC